MINKRSLLDAYFAFLGSPSTHLAMLFTCLFVLRDPGDITDELWKDKTKDVFRMSIA